MNILRFDRPIGRPDIAQVHGLGVETTGDDVLLQPLAKRDWRAVDGIKIPREHAGQVGAMLLAIDGETWTYDPATQRISDENGLKVAEGVVAEDAAAICSANRILNAAYQARIARAAKAMLEAFRGAVPDWLKEEAQALEDALHEGGYDRATHRGNPTA